ncbi:MAG: hypothetical protein H0W15_04230 [Gemmatimonadales bacterium]|nr:hypothetical protein [Gemmatimonadales bacterium]
MPLAPLVGHLDLRAQFLEAIASGKLPQVVLLTGPSGVGKQRLALWLAQRLACTGPAGEPCGTCRGCRMVLGLAHPDVHLLVPVARPKAGEPDKQLAEVAESLEAVMAERRAAPLWGTPDGMAIHGVASARLIQRRASLTASEGGWRVFIISRADRLVSQESSPEAANALLKLLEEPPPRSLFVLTATEPGQVLPTIRSRSVPVRMGRNSDAEVRQFVADHNGRTVGESGLRAAGGSIGAALADDDSASKGQAAARAFLGAVRAGTAAAADRALRQGAWHARGEFTAMLDGLAEVLAADARQLVVSGAGRDEAEAMLDSVQCVAAAREHAQGNVNPQLLLATLADQLGAVAAR